MLLHVSRRLKLISFVLLFCAGQNFAEAKNMAQWSFDKIPAAPVQPTDRVHGGVEAVPGVRGSAILLDGFSGWMARPADQVIPVTGSFSVQAWLAPGAYPWDYAPVLDVGGADQGGFSLGLDAQGRARFAVHAGGQWQLLTSSQRLDVGQWHHLVAVWRDGKEAALYLNGQLAASRVISASLDKASGLDWLIGRSRTTSQPQGALRPEANAVVTSFLDGALDELVLTNEAMTATKVAQLWRERPSPLPAPIAARVLPAGPAGAGPFGAFNTGLQFYPQWDRVWRTGPNADVVVRFDTFPGRLVFWRGTSYIPHWVTENGIWFTNEFNETWGNMRGSGEPMSDKQCRYSRVAVLESGEARAVVHWRYALTDVFYHIARADAATDWGDWSDEVYTIYPDGTAVREVTLHTSEPEAEHEWHEGIVVMGPGFTPERSLEPAALTVVGSSGSAVTFSWEKETPPRNPAEPKDVTIQLINTRSQFKPFTMVRPQDRGTFSIFAKEVRRDVSIFPWWNHWPASPNASDGRYAFSSDRPSHSSLTNIAWEPSASGPGWSTKIMLTGLTDKPVDALRPLLRSWAQPPLVELKEGSGRITYEPAQKAWKVDGVKGVLNLNVQASADSPVENPAFILSQWGDKPVRVLRDGKELSHSNGDYRFQLRRGLSGTDLVLWLRHSGSTAFNLQIVP